MEGRHTTDEFLVPVWRRYAIFALNEWNRRWRIGAPNEELAAWAEVWVNNRIRRARRFVDARRLDTS